jgi:hypothetical protein
MCSVFEFRLKHLCNVYVVLNFGTPATSTGIQYVMGVLVQFFYNYF